MDSEIRLTNEEERSNKKRKEGSELQEDEAAEVDGHHCNDDYDINNKDDNNDDDEERPWSDLLPELVFSIVKQISIKDRRNAKFALPGWGPTIDAAPSLPFLLALWRVPVPYFEMKVLDPLDKIRYSLGLLELPHEVFIMSTKHGWLLLGNGLYRSIYFYNPFTQDRIDLPPIDTQYYVNFCFSAAPTSSECVVLNEEFRDDSVRIIYCCRGNENWRELFFPLENHSFDVENGNAVFHQGKVYRMGNNGRLGVFDPSTESWAVHDSPYERVYDDAMEINYLVESDNNLYRLLTDRHPEPAAPIVTFVHVYKLDNSGHNWEETRSLGGRCFFVSYQPFCVETAEEFRGEHDMIYFVGETYKVGSFFRFDVRQGCMIFAEYGTVRYTFYQNSCWILPKLDRLLPGEERWF